MFRRMRGMLLLVLALALFVGNGLEARAATDKDRDGIITYRDLDVSERYELTRGYTAGLRNQNFGYEMFYNMTPRYIRDVGLPHLGSSNKRSRSSYNRVAWITQSYYRHERYNYEMYPRDTNRWFGVSSWKDDELGWVATVNCTGTHHELTTPETIWYDGHKCTVIGISLTNAYVQKLEITDNIERIYKCQCPDLKELTGGLNVNYLGEEAFKDCIYMTNMPYFPYLNYVGPFAFEGCVNLTEVLLPPGIEFLSWNAFGWYDVVKGNYDIASSKWYDDDFLGEDQYADKYKIFGITLYAAKGTTTWKTLEGIFENRSKDSPLLDNIQYSEKKNYPGVQPPIEIDEDEFIEWTPSMMDYSEYWPEETPAQTIKVEDLKDPKVAENAVSKDKKEVLDWIAGMIITGEIDDDLAVTLLCAMTGYADIPKDFLAAHVHDPQCIMLVEMYSQAAQQVMEMQRLKEAQKIKEAAALDAKRVGYRNMAMSYLLLSLDATTEYLKGQGLKVSQNYGKGLTCASNLNDLFNYVIKGDSWDSAIRKTISTSAYSVAISKFAPSPVMVFEAVVFVTFGNSKAGDAASIVGTGKHFVEFMSDLMGNSFYDAWLNSQQFADGMKWRAFKTIYLQNIRTVLKDITDTKNYKYGQNLTNCYYMLNTFLVPENFIYTFNGLVEMFTTGEAYSTFSKAVYDVGVKDNFFGETLYDYVASYYSDTEDVLSDYTKELDLKERGKKR